MHVYGLLEKVTYDDEICTIRIKVGGDNDPVANSTMDAMEEQMKVVAKQMCHRDTDAKEVTDEIMQEALGGERGCQGQMEEEREEMPWDDVNGRELAPVRVRQARKAETDFSKKTQVDKNVPRKRCRDTSGKNPIQVRWVDTNEQGNINPKNRSRLVAKGFKQGGDPELYVSTPPIVALRLLISLAELGHSRRGSSRAIMVNEAARAYFRAPSLTPT